MASQTSIRTATPSLSLPSSSSSSSTTTATTDSVMISAIDLRYSFISILHLRNLDLLHVASADVFPYMKLFVAIVVLLLSVTSIQIRFVQPIRVAVRFNNFSIITIICYVASPNSLPQPYHSYLIVLLATLFAEPVLSSCNSFLSAIVRRYPGFDVHITASTITNYEAHSHFTAPRNSSGTSTHSIIIGVREGEFTALRTSGNNFSTGEGEFTLRTSPTSPRNSSGNHLVTGWNEFTNAPSASPRNSSGTQFITGECELTASGTTGSQFSASISTNYEAEGTEAKDFEGDGTLQV